jgi:hypothetical protein
MMSVIATDIGLIVTARSEYLILSDTIAHNTVMSLRFMESGWKTQAHIYCHSTVI